MRFRGPRLQLRLRYKFLGAQALTLMLAVASFALVVGKSFYDDKRLFIRDHSLTLLEIASSVASLQMKLYAEELELVAQKALPTMGAPLPDPGLTGRMQRSLLRLAYFRVGPAGVQPAGAFAHEALLKEKGAPAGFLAAIDATTLPLDPGMGAWLVNRTPPRADNAPSPISVLTLALPMPGDEKSAERLVLVADLDQAFLVRALRQSDLAEVFLVSADGRLVSHSESSQIVEQARTKLNHPALAKLSEVNGRSQNLEIKWNGERYYCAIGATGLPDLYIVAQIRHANAFSAVGGLLTQLFFTGAIILWVSFLFSLLLSSQLTAGLAKLKTAAEHVGRGNYDVALDTGSGDEIGALAESFNTMTGQVRRSLLEAQEKLRMQGELKDASLLQTTLLNKRDFSLEGLDIAWHYASATECSGDFWDVWVENQTMTMLIADVTGHGLSAAIVSGLSKGCLATLNTIYAGRVIPPPAYLAHLNHVLYSACEGKLLMTMCLIQIHLPTGRMMVANAGHEFPLWFRARHHQPGGRATKAVEEIVTRGERLGFAPGIAYDSVTVQMEPGDGILLYTDGLPDARNPEGAVWGERSLRKAFAEGAGSIASALEGSTAITSRILERFEAFTKGAPKQDDVTFVTYHHVDVDEEKKVA